MAEYSVPKKKKVQVDPDVEVIRIKKDEVTGNIVEVKKVEKNYEEEEKNDEESEFVVTIVKNGQKQTPDQVKENMMQILLQQNQILEQQETQEKLGQDLK